MRGGHCVLDHEFTKRNGERSFGGARCVHLGGRGNSCGDGVLYTQVENELGSKSGRGSRGARQGQSWGCRSANRLLRHRLTVLARGQRVAGEAPCDLLASCLAGDLQGLGIHLLLRSVDLLTLCGG